MTLNKNIWILPIAVISLIYAVYHLRKDLTVDLTVDLMLKHQEKVSENKSFTFEQRQTKYQRKNMNFFGTWAQNKEKKRSKVVTLEDFLNKKEAISSEVKAEQEKVLSQLKSRNSMHAQMSNSYVQVRVFKKLLIQHLYKCLYTIEK